MGITVKWDNQDKSILLVTYHDPWTWEDFYPAMQQAEHMILKTKRPIRGVITDFTHSRSIPANAFPHFKAVITGLRGSQEGPLLIMVDLHGGWQAISNVFRLMYPTLWQRVQHAGNLTEARALLLNKQALNPGKAAVGLPQ